MSELSLPPRRASNGCRSFCHAALAKHDVRAAFEPLDQFRQVLGLIRKIALHQNHCVTPRITCSAGHLATQPIQRVRIAQPRLAANDGKRGYLRVGLEPLAGLVGAAVIVDDDLVLARVSLKYFSNAPQQNADCLAFVVRWNADIKPAASMTWLNGAKPQNRMARLVIAT